MLQQQPDPLITMKAKNPGMTGAFCFMLICAEAASVLGVKPWNYLLHICIADP